MKSMRKWGYDVYLVPTSIFDVVEICRRYDLHIFDIAVVTSGVRLFAGVGQRRRIMHAMPYAVHVKTTGILGFMLCQLKKPRRITGFVTSLLVFLIAMNSIFALEIRGSSRQLDEKIQTYLREEGITFPIRKLSLAQFQTLEQNLKQEFFQEIEWLNLSQIGSSYFIDYVPRIHASPKPKYKDPLVAYQSGVIARFDVKRGVKVVKEYDLVQPGDILVTPDVEATDNQIYQTYVEGKVYAYTQHDVEVAMKPNFLTKIHDGMGFFQLLLACRTEIAKQLQTDESIVEENVLQFTKSEKSLKLKVHYTLLEDITHP